MVKPADFFCATSRLPDETILQVRLVQSRSETHEATAEITTVYRQASSLRVGEQVYVVRNLGYSFSTKLTPGSMLLVVYGNVLNEQDFTEYSKNNRSKNPFPTDKRTFPASSQSLSVKDNQVNCTNGLRLPVDKAAALQCTGEGKCIQELQTIDPAWVRAEEYPFAATGKDVCFIKPCSQDAGGQGCSGKRLTGYDGNDETTGCTRAVGSSYDGGSMNLISATTMLLRYVIYRRMRTR